MITWVMRKMKNTFKIKQGGKWLKDKLNKKYKSNKHH